MTVRRSLSEDNGMLIEEFENLRSERVVSRLRTNQRTYFVSLELLILDGRELLKEDLSILSGFSVPDGEYTLCYDWKGESREKQVRVMGGRLEVLVPA